jgi:ferredoxin
MKVTVDESTCIGCNLCADTCPEVFKMDDNVAKVIASPVPAGAQASCRDAVKGCPVEAISVDS